MVDIRHEQFVKLVTFTFYRIKDFFPTLKFQWRYHHFLIHSKFLSGQELHFESLTRLKHLYVSILYIWHCCIILDYSCIWLFLHLTTAKDNSSFYIVVIVYTFAIYFNKLIVPDNTFRYRRLGRKILSKVGPPMEKLIVKCGIYFVFFNIIITPKQKHSPIIPEQVINVSFLRYRTTRKKHE